MRLAILVLALLANAAVAEERAIRKEATVKAPPMEVWNAWSTSEGIQSFFAPEAFVDARPEGRFSVHINPYAPAGQKGADDMRVLGVQPGKMISFTWNAPPSLPEARAQRTVVIVRLADAGEGRTRVTLTHLGWGDGGQWEQAFQYFDRAWGRVLANLEKRFAEGPVDWAPWLQKMREATK